MPWEFVWWHKTFWQKQWSNNDENVMRQCWISDVTVMQQWCLWSEHFYVIFKLLRCHRSYFILLQCLGNVFGDTRPFDKSSDGTVMQQWSNSDAFDLSFSFLFSRFWDVIDNILSFFNALGLFLVTQVLLTKNSVLTVWGQWWNSDGTVMPLIWAHLCHFQAFEMSLMIFYPFAMHLKCDYASFNNALEVLLLIWWWNITFWQNQWSNSDETVMEQWCNSDRTVMHLTMHLKCDNASVGDTRPFEENSDLTVMRQWWNSDATVMPLI
jgi:hypothetical protein